MEKNKISPMISFEEKCLIQRISSDIFKEYCSGEKGVSFSIEELYHYGVQGLLETRPRYDASKKVPWLIFASYRIRGTMLDHVRKNPIIRLPHDRYKEVKELEAAKRKLLQISGEVSNEKLAEELSWELENVHKVLNYAQALFPQSMDIAESESIKMQYSKKNDSPENEFIRKELKEIIKKCLKALPPKDRLILTSRVLKEIKLRELAQTMSCSSENIRLIQVKAEKQMKKCFEKSGWPVENYYEVI